MKFDKFRSRTTRAIGAVTVGLVLTACGGLGSSSSTSSSEAAGSAASGPVEITFLVNSGETNEAQAKAVIDGFQKANSTITVKTNTRPGGSEGDNLIKTKLATGEMEDIFQYDSGSLLQALNPDQSLANVADQPWMSKLSDDYKLAMSTANGSYGAPWASSMAGGILYNKDIYAELGLKVPTTFDEFIANSEKIKAAGKAAPIIQTYGDSWTSQMWILANFYNVSSQTPDWATEYTANKVNFSTEPAFASFQTLEQAGQAGLFNEDYASATYDDAIKMLATGTGAQYPMLTFAVQNLQQTYPDALSKVGFFPMPGTDAAKNGVTVWMPNSVYISKTATGAKLEAAKKFQEYLTTKDACDTIETASGASGPFVVEGCTLPTDVPAIVSDQLPYFDDKKTGLALEFLSPVKGPALEQIAVSIGSGITNATDGASQYDEDVKKQAQQLGLAGW